MKPINIIFSLTLFLNATPVEAQTVRSVYTDLAAAKCRTLKVDKETGASVQRCGGTAGYKLLVLDDDSRQSITLIDPAGKEQPLNYWQTVTTGFSSVGSKAEWRVRIENGKRIPVALIVRVNASEDPENSSRITSYLTVATIAATKTCVTHKIRAGPGANEAARKAADSAHSAPCLKDATP